VRRLSHFDKTIGKQPKYYFISRHTDDTVTYKLIHAHPQKWCWPCILRITHELYALHFWSYENFKKINRQLLYYCLIITSIQKCYSWWKNESCFKLHCASNQSECNQKFIQIFSVCLSIKVLIQSIMHVMQSSSL